MNYHARILLLGRTIREAERRRAGMGCATGLRAAAATLMREPLSAGVPASYYLYLDSSRRF